MGKKYGPLFVQAGLAGLILLAAIGTVACAGNGEDSVEDREGAVRVLLHILRQENTERYTIGCVYSYDFAQGGYSLDEIVGGLPGLGEIRWSLGTVGGGSFGGGTSYYITLHDAEESQPTGAEDFERIDGDRRACFLPQP